MKITDSKILPPLPEISPNRPATHGTAAPKPAPGEPIRLSALSSQLAALETQFSASPAFDAGKVESIKQAIKDGRFTIDSGAIADKLLSSVEELLKAPH